MKTFIKITAISTLLFSAALTQAQILKEVRGDLDGDGQAEIVVVSQTNRDAKSELGKVRTIEVFKQQNGKRILWQKSDQVMLPSEGGGMMGDPFDDVEIKNGSLFVSHMGGSSWKWWFRDQYRFQNGQFELIGYKNNSGRICDEEREIDANLQTGKIVYKLIYDGINDNACGLDSPKAVPRNVNETFVNKNVKLNFKNRHAQEVYVIAPKSKEKIFFSSAP